MMWQVRHAEGHYTSLVGETMNSHRAMRLLIEAWIDAMKGDYAASGGNFDPVSEAKELARFSVVGLGFELYAWRVIFREADFNRFCDQYSDAFEQAAAQGFPPGSNKARWMAARPYRRKPHAAVFSPDLESLFPSLRGSPRMKPFKNLQVFFLEAAHQGEVMRALVRSSHYGATANPCRPCYGLSP